MASAITTAATEASPLLHPPAAAPPAATTIASLQQHQASDETKEEPPSATNATTSTTRSILDMLSFASQPATSNDDAIATPDLPPFSILVEVIGCRNLPFGHSNNNSNNMETYCVIQYGTKTLHRTLPYRGLQASATDNPSRTSRIKEALQQGIHNVGVGLSGGGATSSRSSQRAFATALQNPIWTIQHDSLFGVNISTNDIANHKALVVHVWARPLQNTSTTNNNRTSSSPLKKPRSFRTVPPPPTLVGKVRLPIADLIANCSEGRVEIPLVDDLLGRPIVTPQQQSRSSSNASSRTPTQASFLAIRCRIASPADLELVHAWNGTATTNTPPVKDRIHHVVDDELWRRAQVMDDDHNLRPAVLLTELPQGQVQGTSLSTAMAGSMGRLDGKVRVKPYSDPERKRVASPSKRTVSSPSSQNVQYLTPTQVKQETIKPSRKWVQAGRTSHNSLGRLYVEILSAHDLPNVDLGASVGNKTDCFVNLIYGDTMVQTDLIDDELSPHWMPWTQRAFCLSICKDWPSSPYGQVLYLGVFGYKRKPIRRHKPIGRVEIHPLNLQRNTLYELEYNLYKDSHTSNRNAQGRIRIRLRMEMDNEREALLSSFSSMLPSFNAPQQQSNIYINVKTKKSLAVARYTACGEYDNSNKFQLGVVQGYIDEIVQGYVRRMIHALSDGGRSLIFWQPHNQLQIPFAGGVVVFPLYSLLCFVMGILVVEHPQFLPGTLCLLGSLFLLVQMSQRNRSRNPWKRCNSFGHYVRVLLGGDLSPKPKFERIQPMEGLEETKAEEEAINQRIERDRQFCQKKEVVAKELKELEQLKMESKSKELIHLELLVILGKVQGIIGDLCRLLRFVDTIITWEESDVAFFLTVALLLAGAILLFLPWAFLLQWMGRIIVVVLLGPQNRVLDVLFIQKHTNDEQRLRSLFEERMFQARCNREENTKLKAFRQTIFGKYSVAVPSILWTPHKDYPLPCSAASYEGAQMKVLPLGDRSLSRRSMGQLLFGNMIPRPPKAMRQNKQYSIEQKNFIENILVTMKSNPNIGRPITASSTPASKRQREPSILLDAGFEVTDLFDEEAQYVKDVLGSPPPEESIRELGVEVMDNAATASTRFIPVWKSVHEFPSDTMGDQCDSSSSSSDGESDASEEEPVRRSLKNCDRLEQMAYQSTIDLGVEIAEEFDDEAAFAQQSWRGASSGRLLSDPTPTEQVTNESLHEATINDEGDREKISEQRRLSFSSSPTTRTSSVVLGVEIAEVFENEAAFARQSWLSSTGDLPLYTSSPAQLARIEPSLSPEGAGETGYSQERVSFQDQKVKNVPESTILVPVNPSVPIWNAALRSSGTMRMQHTGERNVDEANAMGNDVRGAPIENREALNTKLCENADWSVPKQATSLTTLRDSATESPPAPSLLNPSHEVQLDCSVSLDEGGPAVLDASRNDLGFEIVADWDEKS